MRNLTLSLLCFCIFYTMNAQINLPPSGANQKSVVTQYMGAHAFVTIEYSSPDVAGPRGVSRKGEIWGQLVPYGLNNLNFGISSDENPSPWRAGANENTVIELSHDMEIEGEPIAAGRYGLHFIPTEEGPWTLILSNVSTAWGSYFYNEKDDALRVQVGPLNSEYHEWLTYEFIDRKEESCTVAMNWEEVSIPIRIKLSNATQIYVDHIREEMLSSTGFNWMQRNAAANYCLQNEINLEEALEWAKLTSVNSFIGQENVSTLQTLAGLQLKLDQKDEGIANIKKAAMHPTATIFQIHGMGRQLLSLDQDEIALEIFQLNMERNGDVWPVNVGLARGYSAVGNFEKALEHAEVALGRAPDQANKNALTRSIEKLKNNQDIN